MVNEALKYIKQGKSIFPVKERGKSPLTVHGHKDASSEESQVRERWTKWPNANIGLACSQANNLCVLDIDPRNGGEELFNKLVNKYGSLPETVQVITGGGGKHYYFKFHNNFGVDHEFFRGIDCKKNGYVVAPPSVHPSGVKYCFVEGRSLWEVPIAEAPEWLLKGAERGQKQPIRELYESVATGGRNNALARITGVNVKLGLDPSECLALALAVNQQYAPPLGEDEVRRLVESIWHMHSSHALEGNKELLPPESVCDLLKRDIPPVEYWVKGVVQKEGRTLISAPTNQGKSVFALQLCVSVAIGSSPFLGVFGVEKANVLYLDWEMGERSVNARLKKMTSGLGIPDNLYVKFMQGEDILDQNIKGHIEKWIQELNVKLLVIDPIGNAWFGDENVKKEVVTLTSYLDSLIATFGISYVMVHHHRKAVRDQEKGGQMAAGSYKWEGGVDHHVTIDGKDMNCVIVTCHKDRNSQKFAKSMFKLNIETMLFEYTGDCESKYTEEGVVHLFKEMGRAKVCRRDLIQYSKDHNGPAKGVLMGMIKASDKFKKEMIGNKLFVSLADNQANRAEGLLA